MDPLSSLALLSAAFLIATVLQSGLRRWSLPGILLELCVGFVVGNWIASPARVGSILGAAELGVLVLFFTVGMETDLGAILKHRVSVARVAVLSVTVSAIGFLVLQNWFGLPGGEPLIVAATIMTSGTGMTMRVLRDHRAVSTPSGRILLGASVMDDIPAILLLAVALGIAKKSEAPLDPRHLALSGVLPVGCCLLVWYLARNKARFGFGFVHALPLLVLGAWATNQMGATGLLGALVVGIAFGRKPDAGLERYLLPFSQFLVPLYFITVGMRIPLDALCHMQGWLLGAGLFALAFLGRLVCVQGLGRRDILGGADPWIVMWGMVPRGLPGLVFATTAREAGLLSGDTFLALVLMVTLSNLIGLAGLSWRLKRTHPELLQEI